MLELKIDPEFQNRIPPLSQSEFEQLRDNILSDGEIYEPIVIWNGTIVDGHNRWKIVQEHPEIKWSVREMNFPDKWAAFAWMYKKQLGRRNLDAKSRDLLIDSLMEARKKSHGGDRRSEEFSSDQSGPLKSDGNGKTRRAVAKELGVGEGTVQRACALGNGLRKLEKVSPEAAKVYRTTDINVPRSVIRNIPNMETCTVEKIASAIISGEPEKLSHEIIRDSPKSPVKNYNGGGTKEYRERRNEIAAIAADMYDNEKDVIYDVDDLSEEIKVNGAAYVRQLRRTLEIHSELLQGENRETIFSVIQESVIEEIRKVEELLK